MAQEARVVAGCEVRSPALSPTRLAPAGSLSPERRWPSEAAPAAARLEQELRSWLAGWRSERLAPGSRVGRGAGGGARLGAPPCPAPPAHKPPIQTGPPGPAGRRVGWKEKPSSIFRPYSELKLSEGERVTHTHLSVHKKDSFLSRSSARSWPGRTPAVKGTF